MCMPCGEEHLKVPPLAGENRMHGWLVCSAGVSPVRATIKSPVAWMAGRRETEYLKPIDKAIL